ncbi:MAG: RnfABCDGE type electron transport complex subunit D [Chitinispirillaceae bacterium]|nr:RnfABCDGE type electron transport complex subunit D [Chitinispirillaceae bacterium]
MSGTTNTIPAIGCDGNSGKAAAAGRPLPVLSSPPHIHSGVSTQKIMLLYLLSLGPSAVMGIIHYGIGAASFMATAVIGAMVTDALVSLARSRTVPAIDGSAAITGLLLALSCPPGLPLWAAAAGSFFSIAIVKGAAGGLGRNFLNPALAGRAFLLLAIPSLFRAGAQPGVFDFSLPAPDLLQELLVSHSSTWIGAVSPLAILAGAAFAFSFRLIDLMVPVLFLMAAFASLWSAHSPETLLTTPVLLHSLETLLSGGVLLAVFFMATDPVTSPSAAKGRTLYALGCGAIYGLFSAAGSTVDAPMHALLIMNCMVPLIDRSITTRFFGKKQGRSGLEVPRHE